MRKKKLVFTMTLMLSLLLTGCSSAESSKTQDSNKNSEVEQEVSSEKGKEETREAKFENPISIEKVEGLSEDFLFGCDVSTLIAQENSGVIYYNEFNEEQDPLLTLAQNDVNMIRVRVWNDPYDEKGNGYGGGNCDTENAIAIGKRATEYNMSCFIDYHYSDFWADPAKQMCPKAWEGMDIDEKSEALYEYTKDSLGQILGAGVDVQMVQLGNETTTGMAGEKDWKNITALMNSGSKAVRELALEYGKDISVVIQFTNPEYTGSYERYAKNLADNNVDYDIFASSYYPFWHGTLENLKEVLSHVVKKYGKKVMVAEISYSYTYEDGDGHENSIYDGAWGTFDYEVSEQGQAEAVRDCVEVLASLGEDAVGVCYWEPAWVPVPGNSKKERSKLWENYGSGWASSYAAGYDPNDAGNYYGGSAWDNQALFDFEGHPLASIQMFKEMKE